MAPLSIKSSNALAASANRMVRVTSSYGRSGSATSSTVPSPRSTSSERAKFSRTASSQPSVMPRSTPKRKRRPAGARPALAPGQFHHRQRRAEHRARGLELEDRGGVEIEAAVLEGRGAPGGRDAARGREQVLGSVGDAVERAPVPAGRDLRLRASRLLDGAVACHRDHRVVARAETLEAIEEGLGQRDRGEPARADALRELPHRREDHVLGHHGSARYAAKGWAGSSPLVRGTARRAGEAFTNPFIDVRTPASCSASRRPP